MIDLYYWTTPNGHKVSIFLEESGLPYKIHPIDISKNDQFKPEFLRISPNNKIPAIVDQSPMDSGPPLSIFESGAVLLYLAKKTGQFLPRDVVAEMKVLPWLFWQVGGLGPMAGQGMHFKVFAKEKIPYAITRYQDEVKRLLKVMETELTTNKYLGGDEYSIADMAVFPWIAPLGKLEIEVSDFPRIENWSKAIAARPAVIRAYEKAKEINPKA
jgi:GSH-dependent disulfide-bond oxidoreductase